MQINLHVSTTDGDGDETIKRIADALQVLSGKPVGGTTVVVNTPPSPTEGRDTGNLTSAGTEPGEPEPEPAPEPEKPKRKRRTKAQIEADKKAAEEAAAAEEATDGDPDEGGVEIDFGTEADDVQPAEDEDEDAADGADDTPTSEALTLEDLVAIGKAYLEGTSNGGVEGDPVEIRKVLDAHGYERLSKVQEKDIPKIAQALRGLSKS